VDVDKETVTVNTKDHGVSRRQAEIFGKLGSKPGKWLKGSALKKRPDKKGERPDKILGALPKALKTLIDAVPGKGTRMKPHVTCQVIEPDPANKAPVARP
jgi:hypothetical protein